ncbi:Ankyrin repeat domain-containing protein 44 [Curvularia kusanoi]|uniref:Ankyrin repeat domain-containing protein 44 n=1 Tax=Curvularia kusanoi TaxID=90978 RepID=A0A9P4T674_CURKU|nr:Ankyrin repeat domain-containing protein 44 [Curvularia kusanoi]
MTFEDRNQRYGNYEAGRWEWNVNELRDLLSQVLIGYSSEKPVIIFIDALDECGEEIAKDLLTYFNEQAAHENAQVKVCISSRHYPVIGLENSPAVYMEERNAADISWYVRDRLKDIQSASKRDLFEQSILRKAEGGFQWAFLVTGIMIDGNMKGAKVDKLQSKLASCPGGLGELYAAILQDFTGFEHRQMIKLFEWILFAERPLSAQELREALATNEDIKSVSISGLREHESWSDTLNDFEKHVKDLSRGLVEFKTRDLWEVYNSEEEDWNREAQLIHQSVADFLLDRFLQRESGKENHESDALRGAIQSRISRSCLQYLCISEILNAVQMSRAALSSHYPLISYVIRYVFEHIRKAEQGGIAQNDLLEALRWAPRSSFTRRIASLWSTLDPECMHAPLGWPFSDATALHVLVACGSKSACSARLQTSSEEVNCMDANGNTPLMLAIRDGHQAIALMLIDECKKQRLNHIATGNSNLSKEFQIVHRTIGSVLSSGEADTTSHSGDRFHTKARKTKTVGDLDVANDDGDTALTIALEEQNSEVTVRLIQAGVKLEYLGDPSALVRIAISSRNKALINVLITKGVNLDGAIYHLLVDETVVDHCGTFDLVSQLLRAGADYINSLVPQQPSNSTALPDDHHALILAARKGLSEIVELLIFHGASPMVQNIRGDTALMAAVQDHRREVVQLLLRLAPTSVNIEDNRGHTPVQEAFEMRDMELVEMILSIGDFSDTKRTNNYLLLGASEHSLTSVATRMLQEPATDPDCKDANGRTPLFIAAISGCDAIVYMLLGTHKVTLEFRDEDERTPLMEAVFYGHSKVVEILLDHGANLSSVSRDGSFPLFEAACENNLEMVKLLLAKGADVDFCGERGTALAGAASGGNYESVELLIRSGANVNAEVPGMGSILRNAVVQEKKNMVRLLIQHGADVNARDTTHFTPLESPMRSRDKEMVKLLLQKRADVNDDFAGRLRNEERAKDMLGMLLQRGVEVYHDRGVRLIPENWAGISKESDDLGKELLEASRLGQLSIVQLLWDRGARCTADDGGWYPMHWASEQGHAAMVRFLLDKGAYSGPSDNGWTPLHVAAQRGHQEVVRALLAAGSDMSLMNSNGWTPLLTACSYGQTGVVELLLDSGTYHPPETDEFIPLQVAAANGHLAVVNLLLDRGTDFRADNEGLTPLHVAAEEGHADIVQSLLNAGAAHTTSTTRRTPLFLAALGGHTDVVELLLDTGADHTPEIRGYTPLHAAAGGGHTEIIKLLLGAGADHMPSTDGQTPLQVAAEEGHIDAVRLVLDRGA